MSAVTAAPTGREVKGPSALGADPVRFWRLTWTLAVTTFKLRFYGSALGYVWQLMRPLALFGVLFVVFTEFANVGTGVDYYGALLLMGIVLFTFLAQATGEGVTSLVEREALIRKVEFPRMAIPCAVVLGAIFNLGLNLIAVVIFAAAIGVPLHASIVQVPLLILMLTAMALGIALLTSSLYVRYRDVQPIWEVLLQILFYATPVLYPLDIVPEQYQKWILLNPFATVIQQVRHAAIDPDVPGAAAVAGWWVVLVSIGIALGLLVVGYLVFQRRAPHIAEEL